MKEQKEADHCHNRHTASSKHRNHSCTQYRLLGTLFLLAAVLFFTAAGCFRKTVHAPVAATSSPSDNSYMDLKPGERLRILIPVLSSGGHQVTWGSEHMEGNAIVLSATNVVGYELSYYSIEAKVNGKVQLKFVSAAKTIDGTTTPEGSAPKLPFPLPVKPQHIRLLYLVRRSQSDHNMAITAAKNLQALNVFTERLKNDPTICKQAGGVFCAWVPTGMAVRTEPLSSLK